MPAHVDFELLSGIVTLVWFLAFVALCVWAWSPRRHRDYTAAARMPLEESEPRGTERERGS